MMEYCKIRTSAFIALLYNENEKNNIIMNICNPWMAVFCLFQIPYNLIANDKYLQLQWFSENNCFKHNDSNSHVTIQHTEVKRLLHTQFVVLSQKKRKTVETITLRVSQDSVVAT